MSVVLLLIWLVLSVYKLDYSNFSLNEAQYMPELILKIVDPSFLWILRLLSVLGVFLLILMLAKKYRFDKKHVFILVTTPWIFLVSREFNPYVTIFLILLGFISTLKDTFKNKFIYLTVFLILCTIAVYKKSYFIDTIINKFSSLKDQFDLSILFFQMEKNSFYLRIPKNGYFLIPTVVLFLSGLTQIKSVKDWVGYIILSVMFFIIFPTDHFLLAGVGFLFIIELLILNSLDKIKIRLVATAILTLGLLLNFLFFYENYIRHYPVKYGSERKYSEQKLIRYLSQSNFAKIYIVKNDDIKRWFNIYKHHYSFAPIEFILDEKKLVEIKNDCLKKEILCVVDQDLLKPIFLNKDDEKLNSVRNIDGLKMYYLL